MSKKAKAIMIQGTTSDAGKSFLTAGLCRIFRQDGYRVAPFKSQNMALNSFITREGLEMGRAQVMQAEAAGIEPSVRMNPILLKPNNDVGSQVIVNGEILGNRSAMEYHLMKKELIPQVMEAYRSLEDEYDIIVLEGAGSPAEINLREGDIVNMGMARLAGAPVLLAGDIDRGGVFASLAGTIMLFTEEERVMTKGMIINRFRGDREILNPGLTMIEDITKKPVVGVVPYLHVDLDDEDSLTERMRRSSEPGLVDIAVIRLPRIANFTDFNSLECIPGVTVRYVGRPQELGNPDLMILPGTKNTMEDLLWMRQNGLEASVLKLAAQNKPVLGICGGYQMLGQTLSDPCGVEHGGTLSGMGLLPIETEFASEKTRTRVSGHLCPVFGLMEQASGVSFEGYEIHMGKTTRLGGEPVLTIEVLGDQPVEKTDGCQQGNVYGTYVHGFFDHEDTAKAVVSSLMKAKGLDASQVAAVDMAAYKEQQYQLLAQGVRESMDMELVYRILEQGL